MFSIEIMGAWLVVLLTLCICSFLYDDNPFYKAAEHLYVGASAGYVAVISFWQQVQPNLFGRLWPIISEDSNFTIIDRIWYGIYDLFSFIFSFFGLLDRTIFPKNGIPADFDQDYFYIIPLRSRQVRIS